MPKFKVPFAIAGCVSVQAKSRKSARKVVEERPLGKFKERELLPNSTHAYFKVKKLKGE